jgi:hypothetical protein
MPLLAMDESECLKYIIFLEHKKAAYWDAYKNKLNFFLSTNAYSYRKYALLTIFHV